jgi:hypothetical protein
MSSGGDALGSPDNVPANPANPLQNPPSAPGHGSNEPVPPVPNDMPERRRGESRSDFETDMDHPLGPHDKVRRF